MDWQYRHDRVMHICILFSGYRWVKIYTLKVVWARRKIKPDNRLLLFKQYLAKSTEVQLYCYMNKTRPKPNIHQQNYVWESRYNWIQFFYSHVSYKVFVIMVIADFINEEIEDEFIFHLTLYLWSY